MLNLLKHELNTRWVGIIGWGISLAGFGAMYTLVFPEVGEQMAALANITIYRMMGIDLGSFAGYIASVVVQFMPILIGLYAIAAGTGTLAGEEDNGTLEMILAMPLERWQIVAMKALAIAIASFLILVIVGTVNALVLAWIKTTVEVDATPFQLFAAILNVWPITMAFAMIGLFLGAYLPNRRFAVIGTAVIFIGSYFAKAITNMVDSLAAFRPLSLFYYFDSSTSVFNEGVQLGDVVVLLTVAVGFFTLAVLSFQRRNVTVGAWPWQRAQIP